MDRRAIDSYASTSKMNHVSSLGTAPDENVQELTPSLATVLRSVLDEILSKNGESISQPFRVRLANGCDVDSIVRLVQGLALYENEPDAVNVTKTHYLQDGLSEPDNCEHNPLFHCLLLDFLEPNRDERYRSMK